MRSSKSTTWRVACTLGVLVMITASCTKDSANEPGAAAQGGSGGDNAGTGGTGSGGMNSGGVGAAGTNATGGTGGNSGVGGSGGGGNGGASGSGGAGATAGDMADAGVEPESQLTDCMLSFPYLEHGDAGYWLGADSNFSLQLSPTRAIMTFQDSIVGGATDTSRDNTAFVANSVATIECVSGEYDIQYYWRHDGNNDGPIFADPNAGGDRLWIQAPWLHEGKLFLTATRVGEGGALGFEEHGMTLARVDNPLDPPDTWEVEYFTLTEQRATVGKGVLVQGDYVYLFTPRGFESIVTRLALEKLLEPDISESDLEYLADDGTWQPGLDLDAARTLPLPANTGSTIRYHEASDRYLALFVTTDGWPSSTVAVSSAESVEGPWSEAEPIFQIPEMVPGSPEHEADNICYGAAEHWIFNPDPDARLLFTYTCNSMSLQKQYANLDLYVPVVVELPNPLAN